MSAWCMLYRPRKTRKARFWGRDHQRLFSDPAGDSRQVQTTTRGAKSMILQVMTKAVAVVVVFGFMVVRIETARADDNQDSGTCAGLPGFAALKTALGTATAAESSGLNNQMWATIVDRDGVVCAVAFSGVNRGAQWPGSRVISAQKANTATAFSLDFTSSSGGSGQPSVLALSTANLDSAVQPGGGLFGFQERNPVDTKVAYGGDPNNYGQANDPMVGRRIGGINVFGGGLALYGPDKTVLGGLGVSGDSSCADHNIAWKTRFFLNLDNISGGVN